MVMYMANVRNVDTLKVIFSPLDGGIMKQHKLMKDSTATGKKLNSVRSIGCVSLHIPGSGIVSPLC